MSDSPEYQDMLSSLKATFPSHDINESVSPKTAPDLTEEIVREKTSFTELDALITKIRTVNESQLNGRLSLNVSKHFTLLIRAMLIKLDISMRGMSDVAQLAVKLQEDVFAMEQKEKMRLKNRKQPGDV